MLPEPFDFVPSSRWRIARVFAKKIYIAAVNGDGLLSDEMQDPDIKCWVVIPMMLTRYDQTKFTIPYAIATDGETYYPVIATYRNDRLATQNEYEGIRLNEHDAPAIKHIVERWLARKFNGSKNPQ